MAPPISGLNGSEDGSSMKRLVGGETGSVSPISSNSDSAESNLTSTADSSSIAALLQHLQQSNSSSAQASVAASLQATANTTAPPPMTSAQVEDALAAEMKRSQLLKSQLSVLDKMAMAQATADRQKAALLAASGMAVPASMQQAAAINVMLLQSSLAAQSLTSPLVPVGANATANTAVQSLAPLQAAVAAATLSQMQQLNPALLVGSNNILSNPSVLLGNSAASQPSLPTTTPTILQEAPYLDASLIPDPATDTKKAEHFPTKVHRMLSEMEAQGLEGIASFLPHGRAFIVHKPHEFATEIMPRYFKMSHFSSFQRQLNLCK